MEPMDCMQRLQDYLREQRVPYETQRHPAAFTAHEVAASEHLPDHLVAKVVVVFADGNPVMLVVPASLRVNLERAGKVVGSKVARLAFEEELVTLFPDCAVGTMPPFGTLYDLPVYVDRSLAEDERIVLQAGTHTHTISMRYADYARLVHPIVADFAAEPALLAAAH